MADQDLLLDEMRVVTIAAPYYGNNSMEHAGNSSRAELFYYATATTAVPAIDVSTGIDISNSSVEGTTLNTLLECICSDLQHDDYSPLYAWFNYIIIIIMLPSLSVFGVLTNIVNVFIFSRRRMRSSANTYLFFLACSDFMVIVTGLFIFWIDSARSYFTVLEQAPYTTIYALPLGYMAQTCSVYFTVAAAFDCYILVCWRRVAHLYCLPKRARQINGFIVICSILYNSPRFWQFRLRKCFHDGSQELVLEICPTGLFFKINTVYNVYLYMILMTLLPFCLLLLLNAFIIVKQSIERRRFSRKLSAERKRLKAVNTDTEKNSLLEKSSEVNITEPNQRITNNGELMAVGENPPLPISVVSSAHLQSTKTRSASCVSTDSKNSAADDTLTMIMVVVLFLSCNTLALIVNVIETFFQPDALLLNLLSDTSNFLVVFNSSVNCVIYMIFNTEYREHSLVYLFKVRQNFSSFLGIAKESSTLLPQKSPKRPSTDTSKRRTLKPNGGMTEMRATTNAERFIYRSANMNNNMGENYFELSGFIDDADGLQCASPIWCHSHAIATFRHQSRSTAVHEIGADYYSPAPCECGAFSLRKSETRLSFQPSNCETLLLADDDSGLHETVSTTTTLQLNGLYDRCRLQSPLLGSHSQATSYLAEVKILHDGGGAADETPSHPHIYVRPLPAGGGTGNTTPTPSDGSVSVARRRRSSERPNGKLSITAL